MRRVVLPFWSARSRVLYRFLFPPAARLSPHWLPVELAAILVWAATGVLGVLPAPARVTTRQLAVARRVLAAEAEWAGVRTRGMRVWPALG